MLKKLQRMTIGVKIGVLATLLLAFCLTVGGVAVFMIQKIGVEIEEIAEGDLPMIRILAEIEANQLAPTTAARPSSSRF